MESDKGDVKRKALVKVFNRYAEVGDEGHRVLGKDSLCGALRELGFFSVATKGQAEVLIKKLVTAMGGTPVKLDSFVLVMNTVTSARPAQNHEPTTPPPPPPPPRPPSPVVTHASVPTMYQSSVREASPSPGPVMNDEDVKRMHSKSEDRHEWRMSQRRTAYTTHRQQSSLEPDEEQPPPGWVEREPPQLTVPKRIAYYIPPEKEPLPACVVEVRGASVDVSPLTAMRFVDVMTLDPRVQGVLQCVSGGWPPGSTPALHGSGFCIGGRIVLVTDSAVTLLSLDGYVEHSVSLIDITAVYMSHTGYVGIQARELKGLTWYAEGDYNGVIRVIVEAASRRQGTSIEVTQMDFKQQIDDLVRAAEDGVKITPLNVYVPDGETVLRQKKRMEKSSPDTARDSEWLADLKLSGKTGFVVDARWEEKRYRISMAEGCLGDVKVGTIKKTLAKWVSLPQDQLRLFSPAGIELTNDEITGALMCLQEGEVFTLLKRPIEPSLVVQASPARDHLPLDQTAIVTLTACTEDPSPPPSSHIHTHEQNDILPTVLFDRDDTGQTPSSAQPPTPPEKLPSRATHGTYYRNRAQPPSHVDQYEMKKYVSAAREVVEERCIEEPVTREEEEEERDEGSDYPYANRSPESVPQEIYNPRRGRSPESVEIYNPPKGRSPSTLPQDVYEGSRSPPPTPPVSNHGMGRELQVLPSPVPSRESSPARVVKKQQPLQPLPPPPVETVPRSKWEGPLPTAIPVNTMVLPSYIANPTPIQKQLQEEDKFGGGQSQSHMQLQKIIEEHQQLQMRLRQHVASKPMRPPPPQPSGSKKDIHVQEVLHHEMPSSVMSTGHFPMPSGYHGGGGGGGAIASFGTPDKGAMELFELPEATPTANPPASYYRRDHHAVMQYTPVNQQASVSALHRLGVSKLSPPAQPGNGNCIDGLNTSVENGPPMLAPAVGRMPKMTPQARNRMTPAMPMSPNRFPVTAMANIQRHTWGDPRHETRSEDGYDDPYPMYPTPGAVILEF